MFDELIKEVITAAQTVFDELGNFHSEIVYETALELELGFRKIGSIRRQVPCPIYYKGFLVGIGHIDILINDRFVVELKSVSKLTNKDETQLRKYLAGMTWPTGLLINFNPGLEEIEAVEIEQPRSETN